MAILALKCPPNRQKTIFQNSKVVLGHSTFLPKIGKIRANISEIQLLMTDGRRTARRTKNHDNRLVEHIGNLKSTEKCLELKNIM